MEKKMMGAEMGFVYGVTPGGCGVRWARGVRCGTSRNVRIVVGAKRSEEVLEDVRKEMERLRRKLNNENDKGRAFQDFFSSTTMETKLLSTVLAFGIGTIAVSALTTVAFSIIPIIVFPLILAGAVATFGITLAAFAAMAVMFLPVMALVGSLKTIATVGIMGGAAFYTVRSFVKGGGKQVKKADDDFESLRGASPVDIDYHELQNFDKKMRNQFRSRIPTNWTAADVADELRMRGLSEYAERFVMEGVDGAVLLELSEKDLREEFPEMPLSARKRMSKLINELRRI